MATISKRVVAASFAIAVMAGTAAAAPEFTFNGDVDFRLREESNLTLDTTGKAVESLTTRAFSTVYAWNLKTGVKVSDNLGFKFRLSNPKGSALEMVSKNNGTAATATTTVDPTTLKGSTSLTAENIVSIPQAEIQYKAGFFGLSAGILEVNNSTVLNLVRAAEEQGYTKGTNISDNWSTMYNNSQTGLKFSFDAGKVVDVNIVAAIAEYSAPTTAVKGYEDLRVIADVPVTLKDGKFVITPSVAVRNGVTGAYTKRTINSNGGVDFSAKFSDVVSLKAGAAYGQFSNADYKTTDDITKKGWKSPSALLLTVAPAVKFGINNVSVGYSFATAKDRELTGDAAYSLLTNHVDAKWGLELTKGFSISPRYRMWLNSSTKEGSISTVKHRPELMFTAKF